MKQLTLSLIAVIAVVLMAAHEPDHINQAEVNRLQGLYIFTDSKPTQVYEYLGTVKKTMTFAGGTQYTSVRDRLIKKLKNDYPNADAAIFYFDEGGTDRCDAIKFKD